MVLLVYPLRARGMAGVLTLQGDLPAGSNALADFADTHLLQRLPLPRQFFEQLGPDRFRREMLRTLRARIDEHVDEVMATGSGRAWDNLSTYLRNAVYTHVRRRLPYVVDNFVERLQHELDELVQPGVMMRRHLQDQPAFPTRLFLGTFGRPLRNALLPATLVGMFAGVALARVLPPAWLPLATALAAAVAALVVLLLLTRPRMAGGFWPLRTQGILFRQREAWLARLADAMADDAVAWQVTVGELSQGVQSARMRHMTRREVSAIFDAPVFRASLQLVLGPEGVLAVKNAAAAKAMDLLAGMHVSGALREQYGAQLRASLQHAAAQVPPADYASFWQALLAPAWRRVPLLAAIVGAGAGAAASQLLAILAVGGISP